MSDLLERLKQRPKVFQDLEFSGSEFAERVGKLVFDRALLLDALAAIIETSLVDALTQAAFPGSEFVELQVKRNELVAARTIYRELRGKP